MRGSENKQDVIYMHKIGAAEGNKTNEAGKGLCTNNTATRINQDAKIKGNKTAETGGNIRVSEYTTGVQSHDRE